MCFPPTFWALRRIEFGPFFGGRECCGSAGSRKESSRQCHRADIGLVEIVTDAFEPPSESLSEVWSGLRLRPPWKTTAGKGMSPCTASRSIVSSGAVPSSVCRLASPLFVLWPPSPPAAIQVGCRGSVSESLGLLSGCVLQVACDFCFWGFGHVVRCYF